MSKETKTPQFTLLKKTPEDVRRTILTNTLKMLMNRKMFKGDKLDSKIKELISKNPANNTYIIKTDKGDVNLLLSKRKLTSINKTTDIGDFLSKNKDSHCIIVIDDLSPKVKQILKSNYKNTEYFLEKELMINLADHVMVPPHEILTDDEIKDFYESYQVKKSNMSTMFETDPVARYYRMKTGDICRITRPTEQGVYSYGYRLVT